MLIQDLPEDQMEVLKMRYFDDMSSFAVNPKRDNLINEILFKLTN